MIGDVVIDVEQKKEYYVSAICNNWVVLLDENNNYICYDILFFCKKFKKTI